MDTMLAGLEFDTAYLDDILLRSENNEQHRKYIKEVFQKIDEYGFKQSSEKYKFFMNQIKYLGKIIDKNVRRPKPKRAEAIKKYPITKQTSLIFRRFQAWPTIIVSTLKKNVWF